MRLPGEDPAARTGPDRVTADGGPRDAMGQAARRWHHRRCVNRWSAPMPQPNDLSRSLVALDQDSTIIAVVEMSQSSWLVAGMLPGIERQPRKKLEPSAERLLGLLHRWRDEAVKAGRQITRIALALRSWSRRLLVGALASCAWGGGACDPSLECRRIARTSPGEDRPARHRVTEAGVLGVAAWRTGPLHHGAHPDNYRRGRQTGPCCMDQPVDAVIPGPRGLIRCGR